MTSIPAPGILWGSYPERNTPQPFAGWLPWRKAYRRQISQSRQHIAELQGLDAARFTARIAQLRRRMANEGLTGSVLAEGMACAAESIRQTLGLQVYDSQLFAAAVILDNRLAEMATGEGKTLSAFIAAATGALAGIPVHVLTANDYLVSRDAKRLAPAGMLLGLGVGAVTGSMDEAARRPAYANEITYVTARELVFDYLRDSLHRGQTRNDLSRHAEALNGETQPPLLRGLCMAVIDEADSLLIDEALTPLILSRARDDPSARSLHWQAMMLAGRLEESRDFTLDTENRQVQLTEPGRHRLAEAGAALGGRWRSARLREDTVSLALSARHCHVRDRDYLVRDGKIEIIDATTGRTAPGRVWSRGLHALIEMKEGCKPGPVAHTLAQITFQRFFPRYIRLGGMSGTLTEARGELREIYGLSVVRIPLHKPCQRLCLPFRLFNSQEALWCAVSARVRQMQEGGRPVLVGTGSVGESEALSDHLRRAGIAHLVLNARLDREEAQIIAQAGQTGQVTVTTNMAGRGTDIPLGPGVAAAGGLHVLCCQHNASRRIDRQLQGRSARQGDPGSTETWLAFKPPDGTIRSPSNQNPHGIYGEFILPQGILRLWLAWQQGRKSARQRRARRNLLQADRAYEQGLSFQGHIE